MTLDTSGYSILECFSKHGIKERNLELSFNPIKGFGQGKVPIASTIELTFTPREREHPTTKVAKFIVVRFTYRYSTIIGRATLHEFRVVETI